MPARAVRRPVPGARCALAALAVALATGPAACVARRPADVSGLVSGLGSHSVQEGDPWATVTCTPPGPDAWPERIPVASFEGESDDIYIMPARLAPPEEREPIGPRGVGELSRVDVERIAAASDLDRIRRERGFQEWIVFRTYLGEHLGSIADSKRGGRGGGTIRLFEVSETSFAVYIPTVAPRGVAIQLTNMAGNTDWERALTESLHRSGWVVISTFVPDGWAMRDVLKVDAAAPPRATAQMIAAAVDDRLAEWAYGVEAVLDYVHEAYPILTEEEGMPRRPLVAIGSSAGAISLPTIATRLVQGRGRGLDAAVLIGGGMDGLDLLRRTSLAATPFRLEWHDERRPDDATWAAIKRAYVKETRLDVPLCIDALRGTPLLMLHAAHDRIVDASCGDALWEALGRPERWTYQSGHLGLFIFWLPMEADRVVEWVNRHATGG